MKLKKILGSIGLITLLSTTALAQERFSNKYQRIKTEYDSRFAQAHRNAKKEKVFVIVKDSLINITQEIKETTYSTTGTLPQKELLDKLLEENDTIHISHNHIKDLAPRNEDLKREYTYLKQKNKQIKIERKIGMKNDYWLLPTKLKFKDEIISNKAIQKFGKKVIENRFISEIPSDTDIRTMINLELYALKNNKKIYQYFSVNHNNNVYSYRFGLTKKSFEKIPTLQGVDREKYLRKIILKYTLTYVEHIETRAKPHDKKRIAEPNVQELHELLTRDGTFFIHDYNTVLKITNEPNDIDKLIHTYFKPFEKEQIIIYDIDHDNMSNASITSFRDSTLMNSAKIDSVLKQTTKSIIAHNHLPPYSPMTHRASPADINIFLNKKRRKYNIIYQVHTYGEQNYILEYHLKNKINDKKESKLDVFINQEMIKHTKNNLNTIIKNRNFNIYIKQIKN